MKRTRRIPQARRMSLIGHPPGGDLPRYLSFVSNSLLYSFLCMGYAIGTAGAAVTAVSCTGGITIHDYGNGKDSTSTGTGSRVLVSFVTSEKPVRSLEFFLYADSWTRSLVAHERFDSLPARPVAIEAPPGDKIAVAIANSPCPLNTEALQTYDAMEKLRMRYADENPELPLMSGVTDASDSVCIGLVPLLCEVEVLSISNRLSGSPPAENVRIFLSGVSASAEILRFDGFRPNETVDSPAEIGHPSAMEARLPYPIGLYTVYPKIKLFCYPTSEAGTIGVTAPSVTIECTVEGKRHSCIRDLPPMKRGGRVKVDLEIV